MLADKKEIQRQQDKIFVIFCLGFIIFIKTVSAINRNN